MAACECRDGLTTTADDIGNGEWGMGNGRMVGNIGKISRFTFIHDHDRTGGESLSTEERE